MDKDEATIRIERARALLDFAFHLLAERGSDQLERAEYDRAFVARMREAER